MPFTPANGTRLLVRDPGARALVAETLIADALELTRDTDVSSWHVLFPEAAERDAFAAAVRRRGGQQDGQHGQQGND